MKKKLISILLFIVTILPVMNVEALAKKVNCGNVTNIPGKIPELTSLFFSLIQIAVPIVLVIMGSIDLVKAMTAGKEDEMKKGQRLFVKKLIVGVSIFFVIVVVKLLISLVADSSSDNISNCIDCFFNANSSCKDAEVINSDLSTYKIWLEYETKSPDSITIKVKDVETKVGLPNKILFNYYIVKSVDPFEDSVEIEIPKKPVYTGTETSYTFTGLTQDYYNIIVITYDKNGNEIKGLSKSILSGVGQIGSPEWSEWYGSNS